MSFFTKKPTVNYNFLSFLNIFIIPKIQYTRVHDVYAHADMITYCSTKTVDSSMTIINPSTLRDPTIQFHCRLKMSFLLFVQAKPNISPVSHITNCLIGGVPPAYNPLTNRRSRIIWKGLTLDVVWRTVCRRATQYHHNSQGIQ